MRSSSSTSLLTKSSSPQSSSKKWDFSFGKSTSSYFFRHKSSKESSKSTTPSVDIAEPSRPVLSPQMTVVDGKDYEKSFGHLSSTYGFGGSVPSLPPKAPKQRKHPVATPSSQSTDVRPSTRKDYEASFGQLSSMYGFGGPAPSIAYRK